MNYKLYAYIIRIQPENSERIMLVGLKLKSKTHPKLLENWIMDDYLDFDMEQQLIAKFDDKLYASLTYYALKDYFDSPFFRGRDYEPIKRGG